ncbi:MAG: hypothetical protein U0231_13260 [Nitrospiraceae bacterium]
MNRSSKQQAGLLLALIALWVGLLVWQVGHSSEPEHVTLKNVTGVSAAPRGASPAAAASSMHVNLERLAEITGQRQANFSVPRNIFASLNPPAPVVAAAPPAKARRPGKRRTQEAPLPTDIPMPESTVEETPEEEPAPPAEPPKPSPEELERLRIATELNQFRYLGYMKVGGSDEKNGPTAVLVKDEQMHLVQAGETIAKEILVKAITPTGVTLQDLHSKVVQVIPVSDQPGSTAAN